MNNHLPVAKFKTFYEPKGCLKVILSGQWNLSGNLPSTNDLFSDHEARYYTLSSLQDSYDQSPLLGSADIAVGVGPIKLPDQLDRSQIVTRIGPNEVQISEFHQWGGSLEDDFANVLAENLSILLNSSKVFIYPSHSQVPIKYRVEIEVSQFDGVLGKHAILKGRWMVYESEQNQPPIMDRFIIKESVSGNTYGELVAAQSKALAKLSRKIADVIINLARNQYQH